MSLPTILAWLSGLRFVAPDLDTQALLGTALALHVTDAVVCRVLAHRSKNLWTVLGLLGGLWVLAVLILLSQRGAGPPPPSPRPLP